MGNVPVGTIFVPPCRMKEILDVKKFKGERERRPRCFEEGEEGVELPIALIKLQLSREITSSGEILLCYKSVEKIFVIAEL